MKRIALALLLMVLVAGCGAVIVKPPVIVVPPVVVPVAKTVHVQTYPSVAGATVKIQTAAGPDVWATATTDANGHAYLVVPASLHDTLLQVTADGYIPFAMGAVAVADATLNVTMTSVPPPHVDPWAIPDATLMNFRGALFTVEPGCQLPYGPRPGQPNNIAWFGSWFYSDEQLACVDAAWKARTYTHGVMGPMVSVGYHGTTPDIDYRSNPAAFIASVQREYDAGFVAIPVLVPDHWGAAEGWGDHVWTVDELKSHGLEAIYRSPEFQKIAPVVMLCWECMGDPYGWSNRRYVEYLTWARSVFPNSKIILHTPPGMEAPVGDGDETDTSKCTADQRANGHCLNGNGGAWAAVTPLINAWFEQDDELFRTPQYVDPNPKNEGRTREQNWLRKWMNDGTTPDSFVNRFTFGLSGWPTTSANPASINGGHLCVVAAEFMSWSVWWENAAEDRARTYGARAKALGACGVMDGIK